MVRLIFILMHNSKNILSLYLIQSFLFTYLCIYADYKHIFHGIVNAIKSHVGLYFTAIPSFESVKSSCLAFFLINKSIKSVLKEIMINWFFFKQVRVWIMWGDGNYIWMCILYRDLSCWQYQRFLRHQMHYSSSNFHRQLFES